MSLLGKIAAIGFACAGFAIHTTDAQAAPYQIYLNATCGTSLICNIDFPEVPAGKTLTVTNVSCYLRFDSDAAIYALQLLQMKKGGATAMAVTLVPQQIGVTSDGAAFDKVASSNQIVDVFAGAGDHFRIFAQIDKGASFEQLACHISGKTRP
jgi:hypothetical protein